MSYWYIAASMSTSVLVSAPVLLLVYEVSSHVLLAAVMWSCVKLLMHPLKMEANRT